MSSEITLFVSTVKFDPESIAIREETRCDWSHVGFYKDGLTFSAMTRSGGIDGVAWRSFNKLAKHMLLSVPRCDEALAMALTQEGKAYDKLDIIGIVLGTDWHSADKFICSTLVAWSFQKIGAPLLNMQFIPLEHFTPRDILLSPGLTQLAG